jgi:hypothetical protein
MKQLLKVRARQPDVPPLAALEAPCPLREAGLHTRPQRLLLFALRGLLALSRGLDRLVVGFGPDGQLAGGLCRPRARLAGRPDATGGPSKPAAYDRITGHITARRPFDTAMSLGTARVWRRPIDDQGLEGIPMSFPPLAAIGALRGPNHVEVLLGLGCDEEGGVPIATGEPVRAGEEITLG